MGGDPGVAGHLAGNSAHAPVYLGRRGHHLPVARRKPLMNNRPKLLLGASPRAHSGHAAAMPASGPGQRLRLVTTRDPSPNAAPAGTADSSAYEAEFLKHLPLVDSVVGFVCQRHKLKESEADDFRSEVRLRLMDRDYEVFRRFQQRSSLRTYLTIVIQRIYLDYRNRLWGRWRPSAEARRLGPLAIRLETLLWQDRLPFDQACEIMRTNEGVMATESDLAEIACRLPLRQRRAVVGEEALDGVPSDGAFDDRILSKERQDAARRVAGALAGAIKSLGDQDRLILRLKFQEGLGVADIARALHLEQKPLYRRLDMLLQTLREALEAAGISRLEASEIVNRQDVDISLALVGGTLGSPRPTAVKGSSRG
jgi:RNA polymerase sigma factor (sigma-70 family)